MVQEWVQEDKLTSPLRRSGAPHTRSQMHHWKELRRSWHIPAAERARGGQGGLLGRTQCLGSDALHDDGVSTVNNYSLAVDGVKLDSTGE